MCVHVYVQYRRKGERKHMKEVHGKRGYRKGRERGETEFVAGKSYEVSVLGSEKERGSSG